MSMTTAEPHEQWAPPGVHVLLAHPESWTRVFAKARHWLRCRQSQFVLNRIVANGLVARDTSPRDLTAYLNRAREIYLRPNRTLEMAMSDDAIRVSGPVSPEAPAPVPADWFEPRYADYRGAVFYVHGGSFIVERSPRITALIARFAAAAGARVCAPNYRLAPENPCPAAVEDIMAAYRWHQRVAPGEPIFAIAESAGASILLAALQRLRDEGASLPCGILLLSPWVDLALQSWSILSASLAGTTPYTMESLAAMAQLYLQGRSPTDPLASPLYGDFRGFPPILIHACREDILFDDATRLADKMREANGHLTVRVWRDETHVWERSQGARGRQSIAMAAKFIRERLDIAALH